MPIGGVDEGSEHRGSSQNERECSDCCLIVEHSIEVELREAPGIEPAGVDQSDRRAVEKQAPVGVPFDGQDDGGSPERIEAFAPSRHHE
jgi:hypothetical protein